MLKRTLFFSVLALCCTTNSVAAAAHRDEKIFAKLTHIQGQARFERRSTIVPMTVCGDNAPCTKPEVYWSLLIVNRDTGKQYELDEPFAVGSPIPPEAIEISGVLVRSGSRVIVEGSVELVSQDYAYLTEIKAIRVVVEDGDGNGTRPALTSITENTHDLVDPFSSGWGCRTAPNAEGDALHAQIWYSSPRKGPEGFRMRLFRKGVEGDGFRQIAAFEDLNVASERSAVVYRAEADRAAALLTISQVTDKLFDLPSELLMEQQGQKLTARIRAEMVCNRVRVF